MKWLWGLSLVLFAACGYGITHDDVSLFLLSVNNKS